LSVTFRLHGPPSTALNRLEVAIHLVRTYAAPVEWPPWAWS